MSLHEDIMRLRCTYSAPDEPEPAYWYLSGFENARATAAELANAADRRIELLENALKAAKQYVIQTDDFGRSYSEDVLKIINEALGEQQ